MPTCVDSNATLKATSLLMCTYLKMLQCVRAMETSCFWLLAFFCVLVLAAIVQSEDPIKELELNHRWLIPFRNT